MQNTLSLETRLEVANARGDAWSGVASDLCEILQSVADTLQPHFPQVASVIAKAALPAIEKGNMLAASEEPQVDEVVSTIPDDALFDQSDYTPVEESVRLGSEEVNEALALETDVSDAADLPMSMRVR